jgi:hypothetical protein
MNAEDLKIVARKILTDFEKSINDIALMAGYVYDKKTQQRMERLYNDQIEALTHHRLKEFQDAYLERLNFLCDRALREMTTKIAPNEIMDSKFKFWEGIYRSKPVDLLIKKYSEALSSNNRQFIYFVENEILRSSNFEPYREQLQKLIKAKKRLRVRKETQDEINELNKLYGFYLQSLEFTKTFGLNLSQIKELFSSLNFHFDVPLREILAS